MFDTKKPADIAVAPSLAFAPLCLFAFGFGYFATTIHPIGGNVMWAMHFACCAIYGQCGGSKRVV